MKRSVLIADDEPSARDYLGRLIESRNDLELVAKLKNGREVINFCRTFHPDIILLDIEMPGVNGLAAARHLTKHLTKSVIVFITAYDQYAIEAFDHAAVGYLLKPYASEDLMKVMSRAIDQLETIEKADFSSKMNELWNQLERESNTSLDRFEIKEKGLIQTVYVQDVIFIQSESEYVRLITNHKTFIQRLSIKTLSDQLPDFFHRVHRTFIINTQYISSYKYLKGKFVFTMTNGDIITSSRSYNSKIGEWLK